MSDVLQKIKPSVREVHAYTLKHLDAPWKIDQNENPFDMPAPVKEAVLKTLEGKPWSRYPAFVPTQLASKLADFSGWKADGILVGNGSNELIQAVLTVTVSAGKRVVIPQPTFTLYKLMTRVLEGECDEVLLTPALEFDVERLVAAASQADATIICSPNNPTGCLLDQGALRRILKETQGLVVVDEAYHEFSGQSVVPLLSEFDNLVVLHTFSKAMAMAGMRVGYLLAHPDLAREIAKAKLPYNVNIFSLAAAEAALAHFDLLKPQIALLIQERERVFKELNQFPGIKAYPSQANFLAFSTELPPGMVFDALYSEGILVRDISRYPLMSKFLRVSMGAPEENDRFLAALSKIVSAA